MAAKISSESLCSIPTECSELDKNSILPILKCLLTDGNRLRFIKTSGSANGKNCSELKESIELFIRPKYQESISLCKEMIDLVDLIVFWQKSNFSFLTFELQFFKGFEINLFNYSIDFKEESKNIISSIRFSNLAFYIDKKKLISCQDFIDAINSTTYPRSIFQFFSIFNKESLNIELAGYKESLCPLAFKNFEMRELAIFGENSFYSRRLLVFRNDSFNDLNSTIERLNINVPNIELTTNFLHPDVFMNLSSIKFYCKVKIIQPDVFIRLTEVKYIELSNIYLRSLMHNSGMEWIKNINKDVDCDLENSTELEKNISKLKSIKLQCFDIGDSPLLVDIFPDEDFCLYKDFPVNQLVTCFEWCEYLANKKITCTYLWITNSYKYLVNYFGVEYLKRFIMDKLLNSSDYKSISKCNFEKKLELCNKSNFVTKNIITYFELKEAMKMAEIVINILSYILSIFGIITNFLIIITVSSKKNKEELTVYKHYSYLRLNSICSCLILLIHLISWLNQCIYPFQVFCPIIRKTVFMQYFKIIVEEVILTALKFMNSFTYIGFAFNRISLIGKDHNKLVKFMSDLNLIVYIVVTSIISIGLSVVKFFQFGINLEHLDLSYPIFYDYLNLNSIRDQNQILYIFTFISDLFNYFIFLIVNFVIDIGMIVKLRQTLNEKLEKSKEHDTIAQQEKKSFENEAALDNVRSMIIWNTSLNFVLKLPASLYSFFQLCYTVYKSDPENLYTHPAFFRFFNNICYDGYVCSVFLQFSNFLYFFNISIQLFFVKRFDKNFSKSFNRIF